MYMEAECVIGEAGMTLAKWNSNKRAIREYVSEELGDSVKVLGVLWSPESDTFSFSGLELPSDLVVTKRLVLSVIARIFDPLGFLMPFTITAKCLFQRLWQIGIGWDDEIPGELSSQFVRWTE